jgi:ATP-grasp domain, R2K clade family 2
MDTAFLQDDPDSSSRHEMALLRSGLEELGWQINSFRRDLMLAGKIPLPREALVAGEVDVVLAAMQQIGIAIPPLQDYPSSLSSLLHRKVWRGEYADLRRHFESRDASAIFAKPAGRRKLFRGRVFSNVMQLDKSIPESTPILLSEVAPFISEFRFYVTRSRVICRENYDGDPRDVVDEETVQDAIAKLEAAGQSLSAYAIDFGLLRTGETALVEMNDGFSVGTYREISAKDYTDFTITRWSELLATRKL